MMSLQSRPLTHFLLLPSVSIIIAFDATTAPKTYHSDLAVKRQETTLSTEGLFNANAYSRPTVKTTQNVMYIDGQNLCKY